MLSGRDDLGESRMREICMSGSTREREAAVFGLCASHSVLSSLLYWLDPFGCGFAALRRIAELHSARCWEIPVWGPAKGQSMILSCSVSRIGRFVVVGCSRRISFFERPGSADSASQNEAMMVAVSLSPRGGSANTERRGATLGGLAWLLGSGVAPRRT